MAIPDNNMFVTAFVVESLLAVWENADLGKDDELAVSQATRRAVNALGEFVNQNQGQVERRASGQRSFWKQSANADGTYFQAFPTNLMGVVVQQQELAEWLHRVLDKLGLDWLWKDVVSKMFGDLSTMVAAFHVPTDSDDGGANLAIGAKLKMLAGRSQAAAELFELWKGNNTKSAAGYVRDLLRYAYRPLGGGTARTDVVDPRTYYFLRPYLQPNASRSAVGNVSLVATWMLDIEEQVALFPLNYSMPLGLNNVDASVGANALYGVALAVQADLDNAEAWFDGDAQQLFAETSEYIAWVLRGPVLARPDIGLLYYPPKFNLFWFAARIVAALRNIRADAPGARVLEHARDVLNASLIESGTEQLLKRAEEVPGNSGQIFWHDFLGANDTDSSGHKLNSTDDQVYTTSVVVNALVDTWTVVKDGQRSFLPGTPAKVKEAVSAAAAYLSSVFQPGKAVREGALSNAFFSGSIKGTSSMWFFFPTTYHYYVNGTAMPSNFTDSDVTPESVLGVQGIPSAAEYEYLVQHPRFAPTPTTFPGYNRGPPLQSGFPFWSSSAVTRAFALEALAKVASL